MKLILEDENFNHVKTISTESSNLETLLTEIIDIKENLNATLLTFERKLSCIELKKIKSVLQESNINLNLLVTSSRETNISAKHMKIKTDFNLYKNNYYASHSHHPLNLIDKTHIGIIRSGEKISSNGNLIIIGDVNPGAQICARGNIYVWGKLRGNAYAGFNGEDNSFIASLYLNPLQLRINKIVATGPKEKPNKHYPEIAILEKGKIVIKPLLINK
tara:strand:+ start:4400 stop:5053 length:654 start_codon:yes stop_codon:yes gene_type:complete